MKICQECWDKLRAAIEARGLAHLVAKDSTAVTEVITRQLAENPPADARSAYDPLLAANFAIWRQSLESFGLGMMAEDAPCPLCYKTELESTCTEPGCSKQTGNDWIQFAADDQLAHARAQMTPQAWNNIFFGELATGTGGRVISLNQSGTVPASTPWTVTPTVPGGGTWNQDAGVYYAATGVQLQPVPSSPTQGEYSVSAGVYTFAAADEGVAVLFNYWYTTSTGSSLTINNHTMGWGPIVSLDLSLPYQGTGNNLLLQNVRISKLDLSTKLDDYTMTDSDFSAFANTAGVVGTFYLPN